MIKSTALNWTFSLFIIDRFLRQSSKKITAGRDDLRSGNRGRRRNTPKKVSYYRLISDLA